MGLLKRLGSHIHVDGAGERGIAAIHDGVKGGFHSAAAIIDLDDLQLVGVFHVVGVAEVAKGVLVTRNALHQDVVILAGGEIGAAGAGLAIDHLGEVVKGAGIGAGGIELDRLIGPLGANVLPGHHGAVGGPDAAQFFHCQAVNKVVIVADHDGQAVVGDGQLDILNPIGFGGFGLAVLDGAGGVADVGFAGDELLESAARTGYTDGCADIGVQLVEFLGDRFGDGEDGAGAINDDGAAERLGGRAKNVQGKEQGSQDGQDSLAAG